jgi:Glycosyl transferase family 2
MICGELSLAANLVAETPSHAQVLVQTPPLPQCEVCVIVPVRNEAEQLEKALLALANQVDDCARLLDFARYEVILFANNCSDRSVEIASRFAVQHPSFVLHIVEQTLSPSEAHIGWVRKTLMDEACRRFVLLGRNRGVIASTDGDTQVASNWISAILSEVDRGADAVGGRIITDRSDRARLDPYARACHLREVGYRFLVAELEGHLDPNQVDPLPRHFQHYGASFAVTAEQYQRAGGLPPVRTSEDVALYQALMRVDASFRHSPFVRVTTSARQIGRAQEGLAHQLQQWTLMGQEQQPFLVEAAGAVYTRLRARYELRQLFSNDRFAISEVMLPANRLGVDPDWLSSMLEQASTFEALFEQVEQRQRVEEIWQQRWAFVEIKQAIADLRLILEPLRKRNSKQLATSALK